MRKLIIIITLCFAALICSVVAQDNTAAQKLTVLKQDSGTNFTQMNLSMYTAVQDFGLDAFGIGEAVKFTAPKSGWKIKAVQIAGWNLFNETSGKAPAPNNFLIEIRDKNLDVLYRLADTQNAYFTFPAPVIRTIDIPATPVTGDFYIIFYDRGAMEIGMEQQNGTGNSYFFNSYNNELMPAQFTSKNNQTTKINWIIRASGE